MLLWRLIVGAAIIVFLIGLFWLDAGSSHPGVWMLPILMPVVVLGSQEVLRLMRGAGLRPLGWPVYLGNLLIALGHWLPKWCDMGHGGELALPAIGLAVGVLAIFLGEMRRYEGPSGLVGNVAGGVFGLVYVGVMLAFAIQLRLHWPWGAMASWIVVVKMSDIGAYTVGRLIGRHKMAPVISPGKTWEGAAGALLFACAGSWACFHWLLPQGSNSGGYGWLIYGLLMAAAGMLGDLAESLLKRGAGYKDSSSWLPGLGGVLDIVDSLLLSAPLAWWCWTAGIVAA